MTAGRELVDDISEEEFVGFSRDKLIGFSREELGIHPDIQTWRLRSKRDP